MRAPIETIHRLALQSRAIPVLPRYVISTVLVSTVVWLLYRLGRSGDELTFLMPIAVILFCAAFLDHGNGIWATLLSTILIGWFLLPWPVQTNENGFALLLFFLIGFAVAIVVEALHAGLVGIAVEHQKLETALEDRGLLLQELAHRTRNDLASVSGMLELQARAAEGVTRHALSAAAERVRAVARVHRKLELSSDRVVVDSKDYLGELCADFRLSRAGGASVAIECQIESHRIGIDKLVPLGLILNESVTNALKHAFPNGRAGTITVSFARIGNVYRLTITDDGKGSGEQQQRASGLGLTLMQMLASQLGSRIEAHRRNPGTEVSVEVPIRDGSVA